MDADFLLGKNWNPKYKYTAPAVPKYPHQWLWDSCFAAIINSKINPQRAKEEIKTLLKAQNENGFIPQNINWYLNWKSHLTQLPMLAIAVEEISDRIFSDEVLPQIEKYYDWLWENRTEDNLLYIIHPWESTDASPAFGLGDHPFSFYLNCYLILWGVKKFKFTDKFFNAIYVANLQSLARLTGNKKYRIRSREILKKMVENFSENTQTLADTSLIIVDEIPKNLAKKIAEIILDPKKFWTDYPLPFVSISNPKFNPDYNDFLLWHGPSWININWLFARGLRRNGFIKVADMLEEKSKNMIKKSGFWEMYNPFTGKGLGQKDYTWSGLV